MSFSPGDVVEFKDPLRQWKKVRAVVTANMGPDPAGGNDDRVYVRNPNGVSQIWPAMEPTLVGKHEPEGFRCEKCGRRF